MDQELLDQELALANEIDPTGETADRIKLQRTEYGTYEAIGTITTPSGVPAYNQGHQVPVSNVVKHGYWAAGVVRLQEGAEHHPDVLDQVQDEDPDATDPAVATTPTPTPQGSGAEPLAATVAGDTNTEGN